MARGGPRNRGPLVRSATSEAARVRRAGALVLPSAGYDGDPPPFPLPEPSAREETVWAESWRSPQATAWAVESWRWPTIGMWVRWSVRMEAEDAPAALGNVVVRLADQIGLTPAGLTENGWRIEDPGDSVPVVPGSRRQRPGIAVRDRFRGGASTDEPVDAAPVSSLEHARRRSERTARDPRATLGHDHWPDDAG